MWRSGRARPRVPALALLVPALALLAAAASPAPPSPPGGAREPAGEILSLNPSIRHEYICRVEGSILHIDLKENAYLSVVCKGNGTLDGGPLPAFERATRVSHARFSCPPPARGYRATLRALAVSLGPSARLSLQLPGAGGTLTGDHLAALDRLAEFSLLAQEPARPPPPPAGDLLASAALRDLVSLKVSGVRVGGEALALAPAALRSLVLEEAGVARVPAAVLARLTTLVVRAEAAVALEGPAPRLAVVSLRQRAAPRWASLPALREATLAGWAERRPAAWEPSATLRRLTLVSPRAEALPPRWVAALPVLEALEVRDAGALRTLPGDLLFGCGRNLTRLVLRYNALDSLPTRLFDPLPNLRFLDLTGNRLTTLPGGIFVTPTRLEWLDLSSNNMSSDVYGMVGSLTRLQALRLSHNPRLGDACSGGDALSAGESALSSLVWLRSLVLSNTRVSRICRDWRLLLTRLAALELRNTRILKLSFEDLQYKRENASEARVDLAGSPVRTLEYGAAEYERALLEPPGAVLVELSEPLVCDCDAYYAMKALRARPDHVRLSGVRCAGVGEPRNVSLDDMLCAVPAERAGALCGPLPAGCACRVRLQGAVGHTERLVRVECERAGLAALPALPPAPPPGPPLRWELRLAHNNITSLPLPALPPGLSELDLRDNLVREVSGAAGDALAALRRLRLSGNPLECGCGAAPLLAAAAALRAALEPARCADGRVLAAAAGEHEARCGPRPGGRAAYAAAAGAVAALALVAAAVAGAASRPAARARLKGVLLRWGWLPRGADPPGDAARRYDAFVSFAHEDEGFARELAARLESGPRPLRLCVHSRDWAPGEWIPAQIAASVRESRRTVALVSRAFLRSEWARAEFREAAAASARDAAPRLVPVLLEPADALPLDRDLRRYLAANTYLSADHPRFWDRLREALPTPPSPPPGAAAPSTEEDTAYSTARSVSEESDPPPTPTPRSPGVPAGGGGAGGFATCARRLSAPAPA